MDWQSGAKTTHVISPECPPCTEVGTVSWPSVSLSSGLSATNVSSSSSLSRNDLALGLCLRETPGSATPLFFSPKSSTVGSAENNVAAPFSWPTTTHVPSGATAMHETWPPVICILERRSPRSSLGPRSGTAASSGIAVHPSHVAYSLDVGSAVASSRAKKPSLDHNVHGPQHALQHDHFKPAPQGAHPARRAGEDSRGRAPDFAVGSSSSSESFPVRAVFVSPFSLSPRSSSSDSSPSSPPATFFFPSAAWSLGNTPTGEHSFGHSSGRSGSARGSPRTLRGMSFPVWQHV